MTSRTIFYSTSQVRSIDLLQGEKNALIGDGALGHALAGTYLGLPVTAVKGFVASATNPTTMTINIGPGEIFAPAVVDTAPYSTLGTDTTHNTTKVGINLDPVVFNFTPPSTAGTTQIFLIQAKLQTVDVGDATLQFFDSENPGTVFNGPNNTGVSQPTQRQDICVFSVVQGTPSASPVAPTPATGWTGMYLVTIPSTVTAITQSMITRFAGTHFLDKSLVDLQDYIASQTGVPGTVTSITAGTGLNGGTITTSGTFSLANTSVVPGSYTNVNLTVDQYGRITAAANGTAGSGGSGTVTAITAGAGLLGGTITGSGTISLPTSSAAGTYANANITVDAYGRVVAAANGATGGGGVSQSAIDNLQNEINTLTTNLNTNTAHDVVQDNQIAAVNTQVGTLNTQVNNLNTEFNTLSTEINTLNSEMTTVNNEIANITTILNDPLRIRYRLESTLNVHVSPSGNDTIASAAIFGPNPTPSATPFATLQSAWTTIINDYDISGHVVNFFVADGTYTTGLYGAGMVGNTQTGAVNIYGNTGTPGNCIISTTYANCFDLSDGITVNIRGFRLQAVGDPNSPTQGYGVAATSSTVRLNNIEFGSCTYGHVAAYTGSNIGIEANGTIHIVGNADKHCDVRPGGLYGSTYGNVNFNAGVTFGTCVLYCKNGTVSTYFTNFNGTQSNAVGQRYIVEANGIIDNGSTDPDSGPLNFNVSGQGELLPGSTNGVTRTGGQVT